MLKLIFEIVFYPAVFNVKVGVLCIEMLHRIYKNSTIC